jgi:hypothetical protein
LDPGLYFTSRLGSRKFDRKSGSRSPIDVPRIEQRDKSGHKAANNRVSKLSAKGWKSQAFAHVVDEKVGVKIDQ